MLASTWGLRRPTTSPVPQIHLGLGEIAELSINVYWPLPLKLDK